MVESGLKKGEYTEVIFSSDCLRRKQFIFGKDLLNIGCHLPVYRTVGGSGPNISVAAGIRTKVAGAWQ